MRHHIRSFVEQAALLLPLEDPIYEFGSYQVKNQEKRANLREFFPDMEYVGCDMREGPGVDVVMDMENMDMPLFSCGSILSLDTLEHVLNPAKAIAKCYTHVNPAGWVVLSTVMNFPIHDYPGDYWRFTPMCMHVLLHQFKTRVVGFLGAAAHPHTIVALASHNDDNGQRERAREVIRMSNMEVWGK